MNLCHRKEALTVSTSVGVTRASEVNVIMFTSQTQKQSYGEVEDY